MDEKRTSLRAGLIRWSLIAASACPNAFGAGGLFVGSFVSEEIVLEVVLVVVVVFVLFIVVVV